MSENDFFPVRNETGEEVLCELLDAFYCGESGKDYLIYTDNTFDENKKLKVYASAYNPNEYTLQLSPVETQQEWTCIENYINEQASED